jgi:hypothetical protein
MASSIMPKNSRLGQSNAVLCTIARIGRDHSCIHVQRFRANDRLLQVVGVLEDAVGAGDGVF